MTIDSVKVDEAGFAVDIAAEVERTFGVKLPRDLRHVATAGDLFETIRALRPPGGAGDRSASSMAFYALRRAMTPLWDEPDPRPETVLRARGLPRPRKLRPLLEARTGYRLPDPDVSMFGCLLAAGLGIAAVFALIGSDYLIGLGFILLAAVAIKRDPGEFGGDWRTLGSLAKAVELANFETLAGQGARDGDAEMWDVFARILARATDTGPGAEAIGPGTRLKFV